MADIDYSAIPTPATSQAQQEWEPPIHKFFGRKLPNGRMEPEPQYRYQAYPAFRYAQIGGSIQARMVMSEAEARSLGDEWKDTPAEFGFVGAPTFEEARAKQMQQAQEAFAEMAETQAAPRRGRPPKE